MNCLCNLFDDNTVWVIVIALLLLSFVCNNSANNCGCGCNNGNSCSSCGCGCN